MAADRVYFLTDERGRRTHAVIPIERYDALLKLSRLLDEAAPLAEQEIYTLRLRSLEAAGYPMGGRTRPTFVILKGSAAAATCSSSAGDKVRDFRAKLLKDGTLVPDEMHSCLRFTGDVACPSASFAAAVVCGNVRNGLNFWKNREGFSLRQSGFGPRKK